MNKYQLKCTKCGYITPNMSVWFSQNQECPVCKSKHAEVEYDADYAQLNEIFKTEVKSFWSYFDFLPLMEKENIITYTEGAPIIESWDYLEKYAAEKHGVNCKVVVCRNDQNGGTQTFKDVAASLGASTFKENGVREYCVCSTGNSATAYAKYLALANVKFTNFAPADINPDSLEEIKALGQQVVLTNATYADAKTVAANFATENNILISTGNIDPIRVEAKKTMAFDFLRQLGKLPDVYVQAVAGGTGPIALDKGVRELQKHFTEVKLPRMILAQQDLCDPMTQAWEKARSQNFPEGYEKEFPIIEHPQTKVSILSAGNPGMYPVVAPLVKKSGGDFIRVKESELPTFAKKVHQERGIYLGPASIVCIAGFYQALAENKIKNNDVVLLNIGESANRASEFVKQTQLASL